MWLAPSPRTAIRLQFAVIAFSVGLWAFRLGDFKSAIGFSHSQFSWLLLIPPISMSLMMLRVPHLARKIGIKRTLMIGSIGWTLTALALSFIPPLPIIIVLLAIAGACASLFEVSLGTIAQKLDRDSGSIISSCHGFWSLGFAAGGLGASILAEWDLSFLTQEIIFVPILLSLIYIWEKPLPQPRSIADDSAGHVFPSLAILPLCLIPLGGLFIEGAVADWNSVFLLSERNWSDFTVGTIFASFMFAMAISRLFGDRLRDQYSAVSLLTISTLMGVFGVVFYALSTNYIIVFLGAFIAGAGAGNVYPLALVIACIDRDEEDASQIIGSIAFVSFTAFLAAPVLMGWVGEAFSLSVAFAFTAPLLLMTFLWMKLARI